MSLTLFDSESSIALRPYDKQRPAMRAKAGFPIALTIYGLGVLIYQLLMQRVQRGEVFTQIFVMTSGGPAEKTTTVVYFIYLAAFKFYELRDNL